MRKNGKLLLIQISHHQIKQISHHQMEISVFNTREKGGPWLKTVKTDKNANKCG